MDLADLVSTGSTATSGWCIAATCPHGRWWRRGRLSHGICRRNNFADIFAPSKTRNYGAFRVEPFVDGILIEDVSRLIYGLTDVWFAGIPLGDKWEHLLASRLLLVSPRPIYQFLPIETGFPNHLAPLLICAKSCGLVENFFYHFGRIQTCIEVPAVFLLSLLQELIQ